MTPLCSIERTTLQVKTPAASDINTATLEPEDVSLAPEATNPTEIVMSTGQKVWIPFTVSFPPDSIVDMEASLLLPSADGIAVLHATDIKFDNTVGKNIFCTSPPTDLQRVYGATFEKTENVTTFMQVDSITVDLGYVVNSGWTVKQGQHASTDDQFNVKVEVQLSDHALTADSATFDVLFAVKFGDVIVVGKLTTT